MAKKKTLTISQEVEKAAVLLQELVRLKAADDHGYCTCITCGAIKKWNDGMQGAHFFQRGRTGTKLSVENVHCACQGCNAFLHHTTSGVLIYRRYLISLYEEEGRGEDGLDELEALSRTTKKYTRAEVEDITADFKKQIKYHRQRIGA
jgi:hypothetical protein